METMENINRKGNGTTTGVAKAKSTFRKERIFAYLFCPQRCSPGLYLSEGMEVSRVLGQRIIPVLTYLHLQYGIQRLWHTEGTVILRPRGPLQLQQW